MQRNSTTGECERWARDRKKGSVLEYFCSVLTLVPNEADVYFCVFRVLATLIHQDVWCVKRAAIVSGAVLHRM